MRVKSIFDLLTMRKNNLMRKLAILARKQCRHCNGKGRHDKSAYGYSVHGIEICECVEQKLDDAGTAWACRNLFKVYDFTGEGTGGAPTDTDSYIFYCESCNRTYELIDSVMGILVDGKKQFMGGIHYHQLPSLGKEHINCPNCVHGEHTVRVVTYQPNGNLFRAELAYEIERCR